MNVRDGMRVCSIVLTVSLLFAGISPVRAQEKDHAVSPGQLRSDVQKAASTRQANEAAVREMFATKPGRDALKSAGIDYQKVDQAISQVDDAELARLADRSRDVQKDFAAGRMTDRDLILILLVAVVLILIIIAVR
ncbi:MAG TPA: PA2779 family protein [Candidatus Acidoferrum sp.]|jgi:preprotein translocase subunit SecF